MVRLTGPAARDDGSPGTVVVAGQTSTVADGPDGLRVWAGPVSDPFFLDLSLLAAMNAATQHGGPVPLGGLPPGSAKDAFAGSTVCSVVVEVPHADPELRPGRHVAMWSRTMLQTDAGGWRAR